MRWAGRFTEEEIAMYRQAWRKPGAMRGMANYYRALRRYRGELRALCRPIDIPTLLIWAEREPVFTRASTENFDEWVPNLRIARVAGAGHFVQTDAPQTVNDLLVGFLVS
jgi:pimeloyl-ACP methyl ester carboxylesterase